MPRDFHGAVPGRCAQDALARMADHWDNEEAYILSLDMAKGFDYLRPEKSVETQRSSYAA